MQDFPRSISTACLAVLAIADSARAQCADWDTRFNSPGTNLTVRALAVFDDGTGPALYAGGEFTTVDTEVAHGIARWDGAQWSSLGTGVETSQPYERARVHAACVFDDGTGPALFVGGSFTTAGGVTASNVAKWDGSVWSALAVGSAIPVEALTVFDDGTGSALYAFGMFPNFSGTMIRGIAKWNGAQWTPLGGTGNGVVYTFTVFDDGTGPVLIAGGRFSDAQGTFAVARLSGTGLARVGTGITETTASSTPPFVNDLAVFDDGSGVALYASGEFLVSFGALANCIAKWNGTSWSPLGNGSEIGIYALTVFDDGTGAALWAGGTFEASGGVPEHGLSKWTGSAWAPVTQVAMAGIFALETFDDGSGASIFAGGFFYGSGYLGATGIAKWDGSSWSALGRGLGVLHRVNALTTFDYGTGAKLIAAGILEDAGGIRVNGIAALDGASWEPLSGGVPSTTSPVDLFSVHALTTFDDGTGSKLYAGGNFYGPAGMPVNNIAAWNGSQWSDVGHGVSSSGDTFVYALAVFDDGTGDALFAGGDFMYAGAGTTRGIAKWDGASWSALGTGLGRGTPQSSGSVHAMTVFDDGTGPALYVGGVFTTSGAVASSNIAKWDGTNWTSLGIGVSGTVLALAVFDDGAGPALFAGGTFQTAGGVPVNNIAKWNASAWSAVGNGVIGALAPSIDALAVFDDGTGPALYASGAFSLAGGTNASGIAKWDGATWSAVGSGIEPSNGFSSGVKALAVFDDGADGMPDLYVGGAFDVAGGRPSSNFAVWRGCAPGVVQCTGDGLDTALAVACPCGNLGEPGRGCANSNAILGGARLTGSGSTIASSVELSAQGIPNNNLCAFMVSLTANPSGTVFGDGVRCVSGSTFQFGQQVAGRGSNESSAVRAVPLTAAAGSTRYYQVLYRNPAPSFCVPGTFNVSNAYRIRW